MPQDPVKPAASKLTAPKVKGSKPKSPAAAASKTSSLPVPPSGKSSYTAVAKPVAPDTAAAPKEGTIEHREAIVRAALKVLADARSVTPDAEVYGTALEQLTAIGLSTEPLVEAYQKPRMMRVGAEGTPRVPAATWRQAPWAEDVMTELDASAQWGPNEGYRLGAMDAIEALLMAYRTSHPKFVRAQLPAVRELALKGHGGVWSRAVTMLTALNDMEWVKGLATQVVDHKSKRAAEILVELKSGQVVDLLRHPSGEVRQLVARVAAPEDLEKALAALTADVEKRRSIVQGIGRTTLLRGLSYASHCRVLLKVLAEDPNKQVVEEAGRALLVLDNRPVMTVVVRHVQLLHSADPLRVKRSAQELLNLVTTDEALRAIARAAANRALVALAPHPSIKPAGPQRPAFTLLQPSAPRAAPPPPPAVAEPAKVAAVAAAPVALVAPAVPPPASAAPSHAPAAPVAPVPPAPTPPPAKTAAVASLYAASAPASAALPSQSPVSEWATRSAAFIEGGKLLTLLHSSNFRQMFVAIQTINRAWGELTHLRSPSVANRLRQMAPDLPNESVYEPMRKYMVSWALRLDPKTNAPYLLRLLQNEESPSNMKAAAVFALSEAPTDVVETKTARQFVVDQFLAHLRELRPPVGFDYKVMESLPGYADLVAPHLADFIQWVRLQEKGVRTVALGALKRFLAESDGAVQNEVWQATARTDLGVQDMDVLEHLGLSGLSRMMELAEKPDLGSVERRQVVGALVKKGDVAQSHLAGLLTSANPDARFATTLALVWTEQVTADGLEKILTSATEDQWRMVAGELFGTAPYPDSNGPHILKSSAGRPENLGKQVALARLMAKQRTDSAVAPYRKELADQYFQVALRVRSFSSVSFHVLRLMVECLHYEELRPIAEDYLRNNSWKSVEHLNAALQSTTDAAHRQVLNELLVSIGKTLVEKIVEDSLSKSFVQDNRQAMVILAPWIRGSLMREAARNPKAVIAWASLHGREGAALLELMSRHTDLKVQRMALKASEKMGGAYLEESAGTVAEARRAAETPEGAFRALEVKGK